MSPIQNSTTVNAPNAPQAVRPVASESLPASLLTTQSQMNVPSSPLTLKLALQEAMQVLMKSMEQALTNLSQALEVFPDDLKQLVQQKMADTLFPQDQPAMSKGVQAGLTSTRHFLDNLSGIIKDLDITLTDLKSLPQEVQSFLKQQEPEGSVKHLLSLLQKLSLTENSKQEAGKQEIPLQVKTNQTLIQGDTNQEHTIQQSTTQQSTLKSLSQHNVHLNTQERLGQIITDLVKESIQLEIKNDQKPLQSHLNQAEDPDPKNVQDQPLNRGTSQTQVNDTNLPVQSHLVQGEQSAELGESKGLQKQTIFINEQVADIIENLLKDSAKPLPEILQKLALRLDQFHEIQQNLPESQQQEVQKQLEQGERILSEPLRQLLSTPDRKDLKEALLLERWSEASPWLKQSENNLKSLKSTMQETIKLFQKPGATAEAFQPPGAEGAKILTFSLPLMLDPQHTPYPAYLHVYQYDRRENNQDHDENKASSTGTTSETWLRICLQTDHLGLVDMLFYLKDQQVDVRIRFPNPEHAQAFRAFGDVLRSKFSQDDLVIKDLSVFS